MDIFIGKGELTDADVTIPASKSLAHRALICASLHDGVSHIQNLVINKDTEATIRLLKTLGATFDFQGNDVTVHGIHDFSHFTGEVLDCGESGSTLRFLIPVFGLLDQEVTFTGHGRLMERPLTIYEEIFHKQGLLFGKEGNFLRIKGPLKGDKFKIAGNVSSQFVSGLLFSLCLAENASEIEIIPPYESRSYVLMTEDVLSSAGIGGTNDKWYDIFIPGKQKYQSINMRIDGDDSQAAFFACLASIRNVPVTVHDMSKNSSQGDHVIVDLLKEMGMEVIENEDGYTFIPHTLSPKVIDLADCPDLGPALFALATTIQGTTTFINAHRLRLKESDRIECMEEELRKLGCNISSTQDTVTVKGGSPIRSNVVLNGHNDHRIVMALSILVSSTDGSTITDAEAIQKSYPEFFEDLKKCHVEVRSNDQ